MKLPKNFAQKIFMIAGICIFFFGLWQMDIICLSPVWGSLPFAPNDYITQQPLIHYSDGFYQIGWAGIGINTTIGIAYDVCQILLVLGLIITVLSLWFWDEE